MKICFNYKKRKDMYFGINNTENEKSMDQDEEIS